jgi:hypothetical protein
MSLPVQNIDSHPVRLVCGLLDRISASGIYWRHALRDSATGFSSTVYFTAFGLGKLLYIAHLRGLSRHIHPSKLGIPISVDTRLFISQISLVFFTLWWLGSYRELFGALKRSFCDTRHGRSVDGDRTFEPHHTGRLCSGSYAWRPCL